MAASAPNSSHSQEGDPGGQDEVVFAEALDRVRGQFDFHLAPGQENIGVVPFRLGQFAHAIGELQGLSEIRELEALGDLHLLEQFPSLDLLEVFREHRLGKRRRPALAGRCEASPRTRRGATSPSNPCGPKSIRVCEYIHECLQDRSGRNP